MGVAGKAGIDRDQWAQCVQEQGWLWNPASDEVKSAQPQTLVLAHGAGAPMDSAWMTGMAERLAARGVNVLRFEFPYMAQRRLDGGKRPPNQQAKLLECWRQVYAGVRQHVAGQIAIGGKSMGGRMASLVADELVAKLVPQIKALKIGAGTSCGLDMGPLVSGQARDKVSGYVQDGVAAGAELVVDGRGLSVKDHEDGFFLGGCLFDRVTPEMRIYKEEIFGPVLCIVRVNSLEAAMQLINDHEYGNGTCIFTRDGEAARLFCDEIEVGMVGVNVPLPVPVAYHSFGGWKRSLFGDLHAYGPDGVRFYTRRKAITQRWPQRASHEASQFAFPSL